MTRSVVLKIYLFSVAAIVLVFVTTLWAAHQLTVRARSEAFRDSFRQIGTQHAAFVSDEIARSLEPSSRGQWQPAPERIQELERGLSVNIRWVPWSDRTFPAALHSRQVVFAAPVGLPGLRRYWVRVDRSGQPAGAALIVSEFPHPPPARFAGVAFPLLMAAVTALLLVPPLLAWV
ncbi:MAG: hypothetical protein KGR26_11225, partial [Cyanobacteria bacterium REEB65]|nr:hypothetical protein [Cyanobacteria bacterium REEB65]